MRRDTSAYFYDSFTRQHWARFDAGSYRLAPAALTLLKGVNEPMLLSEAEEVIGPLCRLLDIQMEVNGVRPFVIAVAGSAAVGKSTFARVLRPLLAQAGRTVELVATDGFLWSAAILEKRNLMRRKGFPESYDLERMLVLLAELKEGKWELRVPVYSHELYDIVPGQFQTINQPQVLILEGLNVLQKGSMSCTGRRGIAPPWPQTTLTLASTSMRLKMMWSNGTSSGSRYSREQYSNGPRRLRRVGYREEFQFTGQQRLRAAVQIQWSRT